MGLLDVHPTQSGQSLDGAETPDRGRTAPPASVSVGPGPVRPRSRRERLEPEMMTVRGMQPGSQRVSGKGHICQADLTGAVPALAAGDQPTRRVLVVQRSHSDRCAQQARRRGQPQLLLEHGQERGVLLVLAVAVDQDDAQHLVQVVGGAHGRPAEGSVGSPGAACAGTYGISPCCPAWTCRAAGSRRASTISPSTSSIQTIGFWSSMADRLYAGSSNPMPSMSMISRPLLVMVVCLTPIIAATWSVRRCGRCAGSARKW